MDLTILSEFGVTPNEQKIFAAVVSWGALSATAIAKKTGLNRPYIYYALERLLEKGFISKLTVKGKSNYQAVPLSQIASTQEGKLDQLKKKLIELEKSKEYLEIQVELLKGRYVVKDIIDHIIKDIQPNEELLSLGVLETNPKYVEPMYLTRIFRYFRKNKITERVILPLKPGVREAANKKIVPEAMIGNTSKLIYQDTTIEIFYGEESYAIIIKDQHIADANRVQFEIFWNMK